MLSSSLRRIVGAILGAPIGFGGVLMSGPRTNAMRALRWEKSNCEKNHYHNRGGTDRNQSVARWTYLYHCGGAWFRHGGYHRNGNLLEEMVVTTDNRTLGDIIIDTANNGYHNRLTTGPKDYPPYAIDSPSDRIRWSNYLRIIANEIEQDCLYIAPGVRDLSFGGLLSVMISTMFQRVTTLDHKSPHRIYYECKQCRGTDLKRQKGSRPQINSVKHTKDCSLAKHMPRLRAMADRDVT
jgi:hypothetical protein